MQQFGAHGFSGGGERGREGGKEGEGEGRGGGRGEVEVKGSKEVGL
jgi:hypothetical protein